MEILPESRARDRHKGATWYRGQWWIPIYCANCGDGQGYVPERFITFVFSLCNDCCDKHGTPANMFAEPDTVFWNRVHVAMLDEKIDSLTEQQMQAHADDSSSTIGKLLRERVQLVKESAQ